MPAESIKLFKDRPGVTTPSVYAATEKGWRRVTFKKPSKNFTARSLRRNQRRLSFCELHSIHTNLTRK